MVALCKKDQEDAKKKHEVLYFIDDCHEHSNQEIQLSENSDQINQFDQTQNAAYGEKDPYQISWARVDEIKTSTPHINDDSNYFKIIPEV